MAGSDEPGRPWPDTVMTNVEGIDINVHFYDFLQFKTQTSDWITVGTLEWYFIGYYDKTQTPGVCSGGVGGSQGHQTN